MTAFQITVSVPVLDPETGEATGDHYDDVMIVERDTKADAQEAALEAFGEGSKIKRGGTVEVESMTLGDAALPPSEIEVALGRF